MALNLPEYKSLYQRFMENQKQQTAQELQKAQMAQAYGSANKSNMLANLLNGGDVGGSGGGQGGGMDANRALLRAGALGLPTHTVEGNLITPFGTYKIGESPAEKGQREVSQKAQQETSAENVKRSGKLKESYSTIRDTYNLYKDLEDLLTKNPSLTGLGPNVKRYMRMSNDPDVAAFHQISTQLQAALAKLGGQRGGQAVLNWAKSAKPSAGATGAYNMGMIKNALKSLKREYKNVNDEYRDITQGNELPGFDEEQAPDQQQGMGNQSPSAEQGGAPTGTEADIVMMQRPDGKVVRVHKSNVQKALQEYKFRPVQ